MTIDTRRPPAHGATPLSVYLPFNRDCVGDAFEPAKKGGKPPASGGYWLIVQNQGLVVVPDAAGLRLPTGARPAALDSVADLAKVPAIQRNPRVVVLAETGTRDKDIRSVTVHGRATFLPDTPERRALADRFIAKYDPNLEKYWGGRAMPANRVMFRIVPERVRSLGL